MAIAEAFTGSETVGTTEHSLTTDTSGPDTTTTDGIYQVWINFSAVAAGDQFVVKLYEKVLSGDSQALTESWYIPGVPTIFVLPSLILLHGWDITVDKLAGSDRAITWSIRSVA